MLAELDADGDGTISELEQQAYVDRVRADLSLSVDGKRLELRAGSGWFPPVDETRDGLGEILLRFEADLPPGGPGRRLVFENHHRSGIAAYLVNCLVPDDPSLRITDQSRSFDQSVYRLDWTQAAARPGASPSPEASGTLGNGQPAGRLSLFMAYFQHGIRHILTGYDHLLFVSALVLAASTFCELVKVVTAFTLAHTITLTLAALALIHLPGSVMEPLIAASIVCVAAQNVFWPDRARGWSRLGAAFFFGLFHGLGFAGGLLDAMHEMPGTAMALAILAFSLGVEAGHQTVVLPLFALLKAARRWPSEAAGRTILPQSFRRIGSAGISVVGVYYLHAALSRG